MCVNNENCAFRLCSGCIRCVSYLFYTISMNCSCAHASGPFALTIYCRKYGFYVVDACAVCTTTQSHAHLFLSCSHIQTVTIATPDKEKWSERATTGERKRKRMCRRCIRTRIASILFGRFFHRRLNKPNQPKKRHSHTHTYTSLLHRTVLVPIENSWKRDNQYAIYSFGFVLIRILQAF